MVLQR